MTKRKNFTPDFKAEVAIEALRCESSQADINCYRCSIMIGGID